MIEIIPAIDIIGGKCVRLTQGDFDRQTVYSDDPVEIAKSFADAGIRRLHVVDLDGARLGTPANIDVLERIAAATALTIDFGGGVKTDRDVKAVFDAGAEFVNVGSVAVKERELFFEWLEHYGGESFLLAADVRDRKLAIDGWQTETDVEIIPFLAEYHALGVEQTFVTDIAKDGAMQGPSFKLYREILMAVPGLKLIASGGVTSIHDVEELADTGCSGVIIGKAIYEEKIEVAELQRFL
ncbi:MAG: 1-(5-phosphoribosyl)-5-[(5-phosphoribosylamino)methylideneamino]imidazole-4-carboxamide isomerase [Pyrinomonadaceae bacterium]